MNKYLEKLAELSQDTKRDLVNTGITGLAGGATGMAAHKVLSMPRFGKLGTLGKLGITTGIGLAGDYAAVKAMNHTNKLINKD